MKNTFTAIIPARYASTRFEGKPLAMIGGVTMIERVYRQASQVFERVVVATDDTRIFDHVESFGGRVVMTRSDHQSGTDRVAQAAATIGAHNDIIVNVQGDEPFVAISQLEQIKSLFDDDLCQIATLAKPFDADEDIFNTNAVKVIFADKGRAIYFSRFAVPYQRGVEPEHWALRHTYYKHVGLYGYRADVLRQLTELVPSALERCESLEQLRWLEAGYNISVAVTHDNTYGIDTPEDLVAASAVFAAR